MDFAVRYFNCDVSGALEKLSLFHPQEKPEPRFAKGQSPQEKSTPEVASNGIIIVAEKELITDVSLRQYVQNRKISEEVVNDLVKWIKVSSDIK